MQSCLHLELLSYEQRVLAKSTPSVQNSINMFTFTALQRVSINTNQALKNTSLILSSKATATVSATELELIDGPCQNSTDPFKSLQVDLGTQQCHALHRRPFYKHLFDNICRSRATVHHLQLI